MTNHLFWMVHIINICIRRYSRLLFKLFWFENKQFQNKNHTDWLKNILKVGIKTVFIKSTNGQNFTISSLLPCIGKKNLLQVERVVIAIFKIFFFFLLLQNESYGNLRLCMTVYGLWYSDDP